MPLSRQEQRLALYGALAGLGAAFLISISRRPTKAVPVTKDVILPNWVDRIRNYGSRIESLTNWPGFSDFLVATAWTESGGNTRACYGICGDNAARGWFGLRPVSARVWDFSGGSPNLLFSEPWSVALAAWYAVRLRKYAFSTQVVDWLAVRRGWALPTLVADINETAVIGDRPAGQRSREVRERFSQALFSVGIPQSFMYQRAFPIGFQWPGNSELASSLSPILQAVGAPPAGGVS